MQLFYGGTGFGFNGCELDASVDTLFNAGGQPYSLLKTLRARGNLLTVNQADAALAESGLRTALSIQFQDVKFLQDDGAATPLSMLNAGSMTGVRVKRLHFPTTQGEYATVRSFEVEFEAEYPLLGTASLLLSFRETLTFEGGSPVFRHRLATEGPNQKQLVYPQDTYRATQSGEAVGYRAFPSAPAPLWPFALKQSPNIQRTSPERKSPTTYQGYGLTWRMEYEDVAPLLGVPTLWTN